MLFYCEFTWYPGTRREEVAQRVVEQHDAGANNVEQIRGWYNLAGGGAGFLLVEYDDIGQLTAFLVLAVMVGVLAAILPAIRASRQNVLEAIATE